MLNYVLNNTTSIVKSKGYDTLIVIIGYINIRDMKYIRNPYQQVKAAHMILKSTGVNVEKLLEKHCGYKLLRYKKGEKLPYTRVATAAFIDSKIMSGKNIEWLMKKYIKDNSHNFLGTPLSLAVARQ